MSKRILFHLGHPAHFHLFKNIIANLKKKGSYVYIAIKKKDILEDLLVDSGFKYTNFLPSGRHDYKMGILWGMLKTDFRLLLFCLSKKVDLLVGTSYAISHVGKILGIPSININEDDWHIVPFYAKFSYPWASVILAPKISDTGKWEYKKISYSGNHELSYLHPAVFTPDEAIVQKYVDIEKSYFVIRFAKLTAHHDTGIRGIDATVAEKIIEILKPYGRVIINTERDLEPQFEEYQININPLDIHHIMALASLFIGDSQTMCAEAGVLGTPFIRFNDFVDRIGYLKELEQNFELGFGFKPYQVESMLLKIKELVTDPQLKSKWQGKRNAMLEEKINVSQFMTWFIESYPESLSIIKKNPDYQLKFK